MVQVWMYFREMVTCTLKFILTLFTCEVQQRPFHPRVKQLYKWMRREREREREKPVQNVIHPLIVFPFSLTD